MKKKNNTVLIVIIIVAILGLCCCGGIIVAGGAGANIFSQMSGNYTEEVESFMTEASAAGWNANAVADQIYTGDNNAQRFEFTQIVFNELGKLGTVTNVEGGMTGFNNQTTNGVNTQIFKWSGTVTLTNGSSPLSVEMIKVGEVWQVKDIYLR